MSRRSLLAALLTLLVSVPSSRRAAGEAPPSAMDPEGGELLVAGTIELVVPDEARLVVSVERVVTPGGVESALTPPRLKTVAVRESTLRFGGDELADDGFDGLLPGMRVAAVGPNRGRGSELTARALSIAGGTELEALEAIAKKATALRLGAPRIETPQPRRTPAPRSDGWFQAFEGGWMYWTPGTGAHAVFGTIFGA